MTTISTLKCTKLCASALETAKCLFKSDDSCHLFFLLFRNLYLDQTDSNVEGVYETQVPPLFRAILHIGCVCKVLRGTTNLESFTIDDLEMAPIKQQSYLKKDSLKHLYFYTHKHATKPQQIFALFLTPVKKAIVIVVDTVRTNLMPNMLTLYAAERIAK